MDEKREKEKKVRKAAFEYFKSVQELKEERKSKFLYILAIILFIIIAIKLIVGEIVIPIPFEYKDNKLYEVFLNDTTISVEVTDKKKTKIIPYFLSFEQYHHTMYRGTIDIVYDLEKSDYYKLKINSYDCYAEMPSLKENEKIDYKISCNTDNENLTKKLRNGIEYKLFIRRTYKGKETVLYDGEFIEDISQYLTGKGSHYIRITETNKNVESTISFYLEKY